MNSVEDSFDLCVSESHRLIRTGSKLTKNSKKSWDKFDGLLRIFLLFFFSFQAAHLEIKSHGQTIKSIVQICDEFLGHHRPLDSSNRHQRRASAPSTGHNHGHSDPNVGRVIERRWHCLWLRSLEWQCYMEQLLWHPAIKSKVRSHSSLPCDNLWQLVTVDLIT